MSTITRKMAQIVKIDDVVPHHNADALEICKIRGWNVVSKIGDFAKGQHAVYFEIDSWIPDNIAPFLSKGKEPREYNGVKGEKLRTVRLRGVVSQGLLLPIDILTNMVEKYLDGGYVRIGDHEIRLFEDGTDVTEILGIQKYEAPIPACLSGEVRGSYPTVYSPKSDQERIQNIVHELDEHMDEVFEVTEKLDGSSGSFIFADDDFHVCSRNLSLKESEGNSFWRIEKMYNIKESVEQLGRNLSIQGEVIGHGIQGNSYKVPLEFHVYNIYDVDEKRFLLPSERQYLTEQLGLKHVPIVGFMKLSEIGNVGDILAFADGRSNLHNTAREGLVFKSVDSEYQFKAISNKWLIKSGE